MSPVKSVGAFAAFCIFGISLVTIPAAYGLDCSNVVFKEQEGLLNWLGNATFIVPVDTTAVTGWLITLTFDQKFTGIGVWIGIIESFGDEKWSRMRNKEDNGAQKAGDEFTFRFRINYFTDVPQPKLTSLKFLDVELCR